MKSSSCENVRHSFPLRTMSAVAHSAMLLQMWPSSVSVAALIVPLRRMTMADLSASAYS